MSSLPSRRVRLFAICAFGILAACVMGSVSASAEIVIHNRPTPVTLTGHIYNEAGSETSEIKVTLPAGRYAANSELSGSLAIGEVLSREVCESGSLRLECVGRHREDVINIHGSPPPGYHTFEERLLENDYEGEGELATDTFAWKPGRRRRRVRHRERFGLKNEAMPGVTRPCRVDPVECVTGNEVEAQSDIGIPALGVPFGLERTYNSQAAVSQASPGLFGYGWSASFTDHLEISTATRSVTVVQANGSSAVFFGNIGSPEEFTGPSWAQAKLVYTEAGTYKYTLPDQETFTFNSSGRLLNERERNGNVTTVSYNEEENCEGGCHKVLKSIAIADPAGRKITLTLNGSGEVESATDPMGHIVKYAYEGGNLVSVSEPGESSARWQFKYNGAHEMTEMVNGLGGKTTTEYNGSDQVVSQTSPLGDTTHFAYEEVASKSEGIAVGSVDSEGCTKEEIEEDECEETEEVVEKWEEESSYYAPPPEQDTTITDEATGAVEKEHFNSEDELESVTHAYGATSSTTEEFTYNASYEMTSRTDGDKHTTKYGYNAAGDETSEENADGDKTKWEYNATHDLVGITNPDGEKTTIERDGNGNAIKVSRPAPGEATQATKDKYAADGELESMTNSLGKEWKYEYDGYGDRTGETDPEGDKQTWSYNEDSLETSTVSARGHASGAKESSFMTTIERNAQGRPIKVTNPLSQTTEYTYNADGDVEAETNDESHITRYGYNAEDEPTKVEAPNKGITETSYNKDGEVVARTDADKHTTKYERNLLGEVLEEVNPLSKKTIREYDGAGNLVSVKDAAGRTTTYKYDPANRLTEVSYSSGSPSATKYEYDEDGDRTKMIDGTGESTDTYDQLDRLTEAKDGHGDAVKYEYNLADQPTKISYPNGKAITRSYDNAGRLKSVTDWPENTTTFTYDPDSNLTGATFPSATSDKDAYTYEDDDAMSEAKMTKGTETLASLLYARNGDDQVTKVTTKGLPGEAKPAFSYDENGRLTKAYGTNYGYDAANNVTSIEKSSYAYNNADELEKATLKKTTPDTYAYNEVGQRTKTTPEKGAATTYGYDQAGNPSAVERATEGEIAEIKDTYAYNGEGLRISEKISGTTNYLAWDTAEVELPLILSDGPDSFIYGPNGMPIEQISSEGTVTYLHHDQQGSTRLLTSSTGTIAGKCTYGAYGTQTCEGATTTPLSYDAQYTSTDTGLIYMRARTYDPGTAQFLSADPLQSITGEPYDYAGDDPLSNRDPSGLSVCLFGYYVGWHPVNARKAVANFGAGLANAVVSTLTLGQFHVSAPFCGGGLGLSYGIGELTAGVEAAAATAGSYEALLRLAGLGPAASPILAGGLTGATATFVATGSEASPQQLAGGAGFGLFGGLGGNVAGSLVYTPSRAAATAGGGLLSSWAAEAAFP
jgi:RHS repeat-associated protein